MVAARRLACPMSIPAIEARLRTHPDDHASWLVYADWLEERGDDARGRLILLQHRRASARVEADARALQREVDALVGEHREGWARGAPPGAEIAWQHGFVVGLTLPWAEEALDGLAAWLDGPDARLLATLRIRLADEAEEIDLDDFDYDDPTPDLTGRVPADLLDRFTALDLRQIVTLDLAYGALGAEGARAVAAARLGQPESLDLRYCRLGDDGARAVAEAPALASVRSLWLHGNHVGPEGAMALAASPHLGSLRALDLRFDPIGEHGAAALARSPVVSGLTVLRLHPEDIGPAGVRALAESPRLPSDLRRFWSAR